MSTDTTHSIIDPFLYTLLMSQTCRLGRTPFTELPYNSDYNRPIFLTSDVTPEVEKTKSRDFGVTFV